MLFSVIMINYWIHLFTYLHVLPLGLWYKTFALVSNTAFVASPTNRRQLVLHFQHNSLPDVLQQADNLVVPELWQVDAIHRLYVVAHIQLVTSVERHRQTFKTVQCLFTNKWRQKSVYPKRLYMLVNNIKNVSTKVQMWSDCWSSELIFDVVFRAVWAVHSVKEAEIIPNALAEKK